jgi:flagellum-specific peptidoglycan hydrolase FlgJ
MATQTQLAGLRTCYLAAIASGHIFPQAAACEGAVESAWFTSQLYLQDNNIFGTKQHAVPIFETVSIPTREFLNGQWATINADWVKYPDLPSSFADRMATLERLAPTYPHYAAALAATTPEDYLTQVSLSWSTGPTRGADCISILHAHQDVLTPPVEENSN